MNLHHMLRDYYFHGIFKPLSNELSRLPFAWYIDRMNIEGCFKRIHPKVDDNPSTMISPSIRQKRTTTQPLSAHASLRFYIISSITFTWMVSNGIPRL